MAFDMTTIYIPSFVYLLCLRILFYLRCPAIRCLFPRLPHHVCFSYMHPIGCRCSIQRFCSVMLQVLRSHPDRALWMSGGTPIEQRQLEELVDVVSQGTLHAADE